MRKLRVLLLVAEGQEPPDRAEELGDNLLAPRAVFFDLVQALGNLGHETRILGVSDELTPIRHAIQGYQPHIVFNQLLDFHGAALYDAHVVSYLELLKTHYTGCNPRGILLASDKTVAKKILTYHRIATPRFIAIPRGRKPRIPRRLQYPLFVKTDKEHGSVGIAQASIVRDEDSLRQRVDFVHDNLGSDAIAEEYIEGRELTIGVLGNDRLQTLPIWEMVFENLGDNTAPIATAKVKWDRKYQEKIGLKTRAATGIPEDQAARIAKLAKRVYRMLGMSGYGRVDLRMDREGQVHVLEANPNPDIALGEDIASSAEDAGLQYPQLLQRILSLGLSYRPGWKDA